MFAVPDDCGRAAVVGQEVSRLHIEHAAGADEHAVRRRDWTCLRGTQRWQESRCDQQQGSKRQGQNGLGHEQHVFYFPEKTRAQG